MKPDLRLYVLIDADALTGRDLTEAARLAVAAGATLLQYRDKSAGTRAMVERARAIREGIAGSGVPLLINDRVDVALAAGAEGVHLGQDDMAPADARAILGPGAVIGRTLKNEGHVRALAREPVDYACIGGVFDTRHKDNPDPPVGLDGLNRLRALAREVSPALPVGAIAGIGEDNAGSVIAAGADGIAVIGAVFAAPDPILAGRRLLASVDAGLKARGPGGAA
jgi:thiamine-phosphate pyrophosphorylase